MGLYNVLTKDVSEVLNYSTAKNAVKYVGKSASALSKMCFAPVKCAASISGNLHGYFSKKIGLSKESSNVIDKISRPMLPLAIGAGYASAVAGVSMMPFALAAGVVPAAALLRRGITKTKEYVTSIPAEFAEKGVLGVAKEGLKMAGGVFDTTFDLLFTRYRNFYFGKIKDTLSDFGEAVLEEPLEGFHKEFHDSLAHFAPAKSDVIFKYGWMEKFDEYNKKQILKLENVVSEIHNKEDDIKSEFKADFDNYLNQYVENLEVSGKISDVKSEELLNSDKKFSDVLKVSDLDNVYELETEVFKLYARQKTNEFKSSGKKLDELLPEAFALVRQSSSRVLDKMHYDEQLMAGVAMHEGKFLEMYTGEGKTLASTLSTYLNALKGKSCVINPNETLAKRDFESNGKLFSYLGLTVGHNVQYLGGLDIVSEMKERKKFYDNDIVYGTMQSFVFTYLRHAHLTPSELEAIGDIKLPFDYAIVDEADQVLVDNGKNPFILSSNEKTYMAKKSNEIALECQKLLGKLERGYIDAADFSREFNFAEFLHGRMDTEAAALVMDGKMTMYKFNELQEYFKNKGVEKYSKHASIINANSEIDLGQYLIDNFEIDSLEAEREGCSLKSFLGLNYSEYEKNIGVRRNFNNYILNIEKISTEDSGRGLESFSADIHSMLHGGDYVVSTAENDLHAVITEKGQKKILGLVGQIRKDLNLSDIVTDELVLEKFRNAMVAKGMNTNHYVIVDDKVRLYDVEQGRVKDENQEYSNGLMQAIQAKVCLEKGEEDILKMMSEESLTLDEIYSPQFMENFKKFSGITGTLTRPDRSYSLFGMESIQIPRHLPNVRIDEQIRYYDEKLMTEAAIEQIYEKASDGRPVLVICRENDKAQEVFDSLENVTANLLTDTYAKQGIVDENNVLSKAGNSSTVTVSTNMAGRGSDIVLNNYDINVDVSELTDIVTQMAHVKSDIEYKSGQSVFLRTSDSAKKANGKAVMEGGSPVFETAVYDKTIAKTEFDNVVKLFNKNTGLGYVIGYHDNDSVEIDTKNIEEHNYLARNLEGKGFVVVDSFHKAESNGKIVLHKTGNPLKMITYSKNDHRKILSKLSGQNGLVDLFVDNFQAGHVLVNMDNYSFTLPCGENFEKAYEKIRKVIPEVQRDYLAPEIAEIDDGIVFNEGGSLYNPTYSQDVIPGLHVVMIGKQAKRVENQAIGRAARNGQQGSSCLFVENISTSTNQLFVDEKGVKDLEIYKRYTGNSEIFDPTFLFGAENEIHNEEYEKMSANNFNDLQKAMKPRAYVNRDRQNMVDVHNDVVNMPNEDLKQMVEASIDPFIEKLYNKFFYEYSKPDLFGEVSTAEQVNTSDIDKLKNYLNANYLKVKGNDLDSIRDELRGTINLDKNLNEYLVNAMNKEWVYHLDHMNLDVKQASFHQGELDKAFGQLTKPYADQLKINVVDEFLETVFDLKLPKNYMDSKSDWSLIDGSYKNMEPIGPMENVILKSIREKLVHDNLRHQVFVDDKTFDQYSYFKSDKLLVDEEVSKYVSKWKHYTNKYSFGLLFPNYDFDMVIANIEKGKLAGLKRAMNKVSFGGLFSKSSAKKLHNPFDNVYYENILKDAKKSLNLEDKNKLEYEKKLVGNDYSKLVSIDRLIEKDDSFRNDFTSKEKMFWKMRHFSTTPILKDIRKRYSTFVVGKENTHIVDTIPFKAEVADVMFDANVREELQKVVVGLRDGHFGDLKILDSEDIEKIKLITNEVRV